MGQMQKHHRRVFTALMVTLLSEFGAISSAPADETQSQSLPVEVCLVGNRQSSLTGDLMAKVQARVQSVLDSLQPRHFAARRTSHEAENWFAVHALDDLTPQLRKTFGLDRADKTIVVGLKAIGGTCEISAVEFDAELATIGKMRHATVVQREMIGDVAARLTVQSWAPKGTIQDRDGNEFIIQFPCLEAIEHLTQFSRLDSVGSLQIFSNPDGGDQARLTFFPENCLLIEKIENRQLIARLALAPRDQSWFTRLRSAGAHYGVRLLQPVADDVTVAIRTQEDFTPGEGFSVISSDSVLSDPERLGRWRGRSNAAGELELQSHATSHEFITVAYAGGYLTKVFIPGSGQTRLQFDVPRNDIRVESLLALTRLEEEIADARTMWNHWSARLQKAAESLDSASAKVAVEEARQFTKGLDWQAIQAKLTNIKETGNKTGLKDLASRSDRTLKIAVSLQASFKLSDFEAKETSITIADLRKQTNEAQTNREWQKLVEVLEKLTAVDPQDQNAKQLLGAVRPRLQPRNAENAAARTAVEGYFTIADIDDLLTKWDEIHKVLNVLASNDDVLRLLEFDKVFEKWNQVAQDEATALATQVSAKQNLSPQETTKLTNRAKQLESLLQELLAIRTKTQDLVKSTFKPPRTN